MNEDIETLKDLILQALPYHKKSASGFYKTKCPVCNDSKERGGWTFKDDAIAYNCFRGKCDATVVHKGGEYITRKFRMVCEAFGIQIPAGLRAMGRKRQLEDLNKNLYEPHTYKDLQLPEGLELYDPEVHRKFSRHLLEKRGLTDTDYLVGRKGDMRGRLVIPFFFYDKLIGWQGYNPDAALHYLKSSGNTDMLYLPTGEIPDEPFVFEGVFDAKSIPTGIATLASTVTKKQAYFLRNKNPILVPDRKDSGFFEVARKYGWRLCIPEWKQKDASEVRRDYGILVLAKMLHDGIMSNYTSAEARYRLWKQ